MKFRVESLNLVSSLSVITPSERGLSLISDKISERYSSLRNAPNRSLGCLFMERFAAPIDI
jgi:hypothetical protein